LNLYKNYACKYTKVYTAPTPGAVVTGYDRTRLELDFSSVIVLDSGATPGLVVPREVSRKFFQLVGLRIIHPCGFLLDRFRTICFVDLGQAVVAIVGPLYIQIVHHARIERSLGFSAWSEQKVR